MLEAHGILSSDSVTRNLTRFSAGALFRGLAQHWGAGLPSTISHDSHRLAGWTRPACVSFQPGLTLLHGTTMIPQTVEEQAFLDQTYREHLARRVEAETAPYQDELRRLIADHLDGSEELHACAATAFIAPTLARRVAPTVFELEDDEFLVPMDHLQQVQPGVFRHGELVLFAHPYLRRSMSRWNNINAPLLHHLEALSAKSEVTTRIRLDPDMVGLAESAQMPLELQYWWGPKFSDDLTSIAAGVTRHEATAEERYFHGISRTEFWWHSRDSQHTLEAEELRDMPTHGAAPERYGCRYVHSIVDEATGRIVHLDGAIREYSEEEMVARIDYSIADAGRRTIYSKLWRVDGEISLSDWKLLIHHHFRDNSLIGEYFGANVASTAQAASDETADQPSAPLEDSGDAHSELLPPEITAGGGVRILLSLRELAKKPEKTGRTMRALESLTSAEGPAPVVEADALEIVKLLRRSGEELDLPEGALRLGFEDRYHTFPLVVHDTTEQVRSTLNAFSQLLSAWINDDADRVAAFSIAAPHIGREMRVSMIGHAADLLTQIERLQGLFRCEDEDAIAAWVDETAELIAVGIDASNPVGPDPVLVRCMTPHHTFRVPRTMIDPDHLEVRMRNSRPEFLLRIPTGDTSLVCAVKRGTLRPALAWLISEAQCSKCEMDYDECACSKYLDDSVHQRCTNAQVAFSFWTDRPA